GGKPFTKGELLVYNQLGIKVLSQPVQENAFPLAINLDVLPAGVYFVQLKKDGDFLEPQRLVVTK
ncbi:MAG: T9SS type A sorting domain-containing protein, partial [Flammeovirgaceae bacterium]